MDEEIDVILSRRFLIEFIELYKSVPALWQFTHEDYNDRRKKDKAYQLLIAKLQEVDLTANKHSVTRRIRSLRSIYRRELRKIEESIKNGAKGNEIYTPKWCFFEKLQFLQDCGFKNPVSLSVDDDYTEEEEDNTKQGGEEDDDYTNLAVDGSKQHMSNFHCERTNSSESKRRNAALDFVDEHSIFGEYVANELRLMHSEENRRELKRLIQYNIVTMTERDDQEYFPLKSDENYESI